MTRLTADLDGLAQFDFGDAFFEMTENAKQFFGRSKRTVFATLRIESRGHEFFELGAQQGEVPAAIRDVDRWHPVQKRAWEKDFRSIAAGTADGFKQC